jgi:hypothetical protein
MKWLVKRWWFSLLVVVVVAVVVVHERLGAAVKDILFDRACMLFPALSVQNYRDHVERTAGPMLKLVEMLSASDPNRTGWRNSGANTTRSSRRISSTMWSVRIICSRARQKSKVRSRLN